MCSKKSCMYVPVCLIEAAIHKIKIFGWKSTFQMLIFSALSVGVPTAATDRDFGAWSLFSAVSASSLIDVLSGSVIVVIAKTATIIPITPLKKYGTLHPCRPIEDHKNN